MKNLKRSFGLLAIACMVIFSACKKSDDSTGTPSPGNITTGDWRISFYHEPNEDHTSDFSGYVFTFDSSGQMTATLSGITTTGTWSLDDSGNELHISLGNTNPLDELSKGWLIISITDSEMILKDDDASHLEELHFTKI